MAGKVKKPGKRGRKPAKIDLKAKLERSRQSARECRARKKLRYQYLEELVSSKERAICALREELEMVNAHLDLDGHDCCDWPGAELIKSLFLSSYAVQAMVFGHGPRQDSLRDQGPAHWGGPQDSCRGQQHQKQQKQQDGSEQQ